MTFLDDSDFDHFNDDANSSTPPMGRPFRLRKAAGPEFRLPTALSGTLILADTVTIVFTSLAFYLLRDCGHIAFLPHILLRCTYTALPDAVVVGLVAITVLFSNIYFNRHASSWPGFARISGRLTVIFVTGLIFLYWLGNPFIDMRVLLLPVMLLLGLLAQRAISFPIVQWFLRTARGVHKLVIYGAGLEGQSCALHLMNNIGPNTRLVGIVDCRHDRVPTAVAGIPVYRGVTSLRDVLAGLNCRELIIALPWVATDRVRTLCDSISSLPLSVRLADPKLAGYATGLSLVSGIPFLHVLEPPFKGTQRIRKRAIDCLASTILLVVLAPAMGLIAVFIRLDSSGPILFKQRREGANGTEFDVYKFRTLYHDQSDPRCVRQASTTDPRVTRVGRFLRATGLDELPQIFNVLKGEMSLVGPRPHATGMSISGHRNTDLVRQYERRRVVKPGITGWAQVNANRGPIDSVRMLRSRVALDIRYIEHRSDLLDLRIIAATAVDLLRDVTVLVGRMLFGRIKHTFRGGDKNRMVKDEMYPVHDESD